jgi:catechol 2,3-dioxygenase-like lactoylglutathione lyase family enzyme
MFDHVTIYVPDREASRSFFDTVLVQLGIATSYRTNTFSEYDDFSMTHADNEHDATTRLHIGFAAPSREHVDAFWQAGVDAGYADDGAPGRGRSTCPTIYGAFLRDPDGNSIEAVHYADVPRRTGVVDHVWIRVADLEASTAFYTAWWPACLGLTIHEHPSARRSKGRTAAPSRSSRASPPSTSTWPSPTDIAGVDRFHAELTAAGHRDNGAPGERPRHGAGTTPRTSWTRMATTSRP